MQFTPLEVPAAEKENLGMADEVKQVDRARKPLLAAHLGEGNFEYKSGR